MEAGCKNRCPESAGEARGSGNSPIGVIEPKHRRTFTTEVALGRGDPLVGGVPVHNRLVNAEGYGRSEVLRRAVKHGFRDNMSGFEGSVQSPVRGNTRKDGTLQLTSAFVGKHSEAPRPGIRNNGPRSDGKRANDVH